ncbi:MAG: divergent PAP2 family protein [Clostridia bacterium]|nr:divergent PAP2 family protein [Clostridia bacterium]
MSYINEFLNNKLIFASVISWAAAQIIKMIIDLWVSGKIDWELMFSSGGMPSSHSSFVCALAASAGLTEGFDSVAFAISFVLAIVVMYDAAGVRRAAGSHAVIINKLLENLNIKIDENLKELLGHTPIQVGAGAILGIVIAVICNML